jgi:hypothetical protein
VGAVAAMVPVDSVGGNDASVPGRRAPAQEADRQRPPNTPARRPGSATDGHVIPTVVAVGLRGLALRLRTWPAARADQPKRSGVLVGHPTGGTGWVLTVKAPEELGRR